MGRATEVALEARRGEKVSPGLCQRGTLSGTGNLNVGNLDRPYGGRTLQPFAKRCGPAASHAHAPAPGWAPRPARWTLRHGQGLAPDPPGPRGRWTPTSNPQPSTAPRGPEEQRPRGPSRQGVATGGCVGRGGGRAGNRPLALVPMHPSTAQGPRESGAAAVQPAGRGHHGGSLGPGPRPAVSHHPASSSPGQAEPSRWAV